MSCRRIDNCKDDKNVEYTQAECKSFTACLGGGRQLEFDGTCMRLSGNVTIADGWYTEVQIAGGCIVAARSAPAPTYIMPPCAPNPSDCSGGSGSGGISLSNDPANLSTLVGGRLLTKLNIGQTSGITVTGAGTPSDPLKFTVTATGGVGYPNISSSTPQVLEVANPTPGNYSISITKSKLPAGEYGRFTVDAYGRVVGYDNSDGGMGGIISISGVNGVTANTSGGVTTVALDTIKDLTPGTYTLGGYTVSIDSHGRVTNAKQSVDVNAGVYQLGAYDVTVNNTGSITKIEEATLSQMSMTVFVAKLNGDAFAASDDVRELAVDLPIGGNLYIEYNGLMASNVTSTPQVTDTAYGMLKVYVDGALMNDAVILRSQGGVLWFKGVTGGTVSAGSHVITFEGNSVMANPAIVRIEIVSRI